MLDFFKENTGNIIAVVIVLIGIILGIRCGYINQVKQGLLYIVCKAEEIYGGGTGTLKYAYVANEIYKLLPSLVRVFVSVDTIDDLIETAVEEMKEYLAKNDSAKAVVTNTANVSVIETK